MTLQHLLLDPWQVRIATSVAVVESQCTYRLRLADRPCPAALYVRELSLTDAVRLFDSGCLVGVAFPSSEKQEPLPLVHGVASLPLGTPVELEVIFEVAYARREINASSHY